jgi:hypothetical protein
MNKDILISKLISEKAELIVMITDRISKGIHDKELLESFLENPFSLSVYFEDSELDTFHAYDLGRYDHIEEMIRQLNQK